MTSIAARDHETDRQFRLVWMIGNDTEIARAASRLKLGIECQVEHVLPSRRRRDVRPFCEERSGNVPNSFGRAGHWPTE